MEQERVTALSRMGRSLDDITPKPPDLIGAAGAGEAATASDNSVLEPVVAFGDFQWAPPKDWQKFERLCHMLWGKIWRDSNAQMNGRAGQKQHGVDVFGTPAGKTRVHGVQCKRKDSLLHTLLTAEEVLVEVDNAKQFQPPLEELIIATCAPSDVALQTLARNLTEEHAAQGLFRVHIFGWSEIVERMAEHPEVIARVYGLERRREGQTNAAPRAEVRHAEIITGQLTLQAQLERLTAQLAPAADGPVHAKLDVSRSLLQAHDYRPALQVLEELREREWPSANASVRFRIATNLGAAFVGLGEYANAGNWYLEAFEYDPTSDKALANRALGFLLLDRAPEALNAAQVAREKHPTSPLAWKAYLNVLTWVSPQEPLPEVPGELSNDPDILHLRADSLARRSQWSEAEAALRQLVVLPQFDVMAKARLAEVILVQTTGGRFYGGVPYTVAQMARLTEALALLDETWKGLKPDDRLASIHLVLNACAVRAVLGQMQEAESALDAALAVAADAPALLAWKIRLVALRGDGATAIKLLEKISPESVEGYPVIAANAYRAANQVSRAADLLEQYLRSPSDPESVEAIELAGDARCMFADLVCQADLEHAEARFDALPGVDALATVRATVMLARALREAGRRETAARYLEQARQPLTESASDRDRLILADALAEFEEYGAAVTIYEKDVATGSDTPSLREYVRCLLELDQRRRLTDLMATLPEALKCKAHYEWVAAAVYLRSGQWPAARAALERCLALEPDNLPTRLLWAEISVRQGDPKLARRWLDTVNIRDKELTLEQLLRIGPLRHALEQPELAAAVFYEALRRFPQEPRAHLAFHSSMLFKGRPEWAPESQTVVEGDRLVRLRDDSGRESVYILEDRPESQLLREEIATASELGKRLLGRKVGETVPGHTSDLAVHDMTVVGIEHKYVYALHDSRSRFNTRFPQETGMVEVKMPLHGSAEERFAPMLQAVKDRAEHVRHLEMLYSNGLPIAALGALMGSSSSETWQGMVGRTGVPVRVCLGNAEERAKAVDLIKQPQPRFVLEPIALLELDALKALEAAQSLGTLCVVESTLDELRDRIAELDRHPDGYKSMAEHDGKLILHEVTAQVTAIERKRLLTLLEWTQAHCEVIPAVPKVDLRHDLAAGLNRGLGPAVYDTLLAAQGACYVLVSDDLHLRQLALTEFGVEGVWLQPLLMYAADTLRFGAADYQRAVIQLAVWNHHFISINADQLLFAAKLKNWDVTAEFEALARTMELSRSEFVGNVGVCFRFLQELWKKGRRRGRRGPTYTQGRRLTHALLRGVDPGSSAQTEAFLGQLDGAVRRGWLHPNAVQAVREWYRKQKLRPVVT
jgi:tetratricopeptide (TPR) repeat protein